MLDIRTVGQGLGWSSNYWAVFNDFKIFEKEVFEEKITYKEDQRKRYSDQKIKENLNSLPDKYNISFNKADIPRYVLIIDEINRGNVSQIFGELITLIEEDKRLGKTERLKITLPYSKEKFGVPPNVYILGTMNTADRSVEALDTALRRRFCFEEMAPNPELIASEGVLNKDGGILDGINLPKLLRVINLRIEKLLDKDHQIGHSYFMNISDLDGLKGAFQKSIIPLLQEYFYGDYGKIGLVLGKGFIRKKNWDNKIDSFADFPSESSYDFDDKDVYQIIDYSDKGLVHEVKIGDKTIEMNFMKAIKLLMKEAIE
ncbi:MAG: AAA family ATPase [Bacteroidetes bacterium]|nr:AAA family ATPase [Bacteroidota bacterium]